MTRPHRTDRPTTGTTDDRRHGRLLRLIATAAVIVTAAALLGACSDDGGSGANGEDASTTERSEGVDRSDVLAELAQEVIVPAYEELAAATRTLATATSELCDAPSPETFADARQAWNEAAGAWMRTAAFRFGPATRLRSTGKIAYEADTAKLQQLLDTPGELPEEPTPESVDGLGADVRGLNSIEHLLFTPTDVTELDARSCRYAASAAALVADAADDVVVGWTEGSELSSESGEPFVDQFSHPGGDSMFADEDDVVSELLNASIGTLAEVGDMGLGPASGETTGEPDPAGTDSGAAHRALADMANALTSVALVNGSADAGDRGLAAIVASQSEDAAARSTAELDAALDAVEAIPAPLAELDPGDAAQLRSVVDAYEAVTAARVTFRTELASLLGVTVGFSDADGDA